MLGSFKTKYGARPDNNMDTVLVHITYVVILEHMLIVFVCLRPPSLPWAAYISVCINVVLEVVTFSILPNYCSHLNLLRANTFRVASWMRCVYEWSCASDHYNISLSCFNKSNKSKNVHFKSVSLPLIYPDARTSKSVRLSVYWAHHRPPIIQRFRVQNSIRCRCRRYSIDPFLFTN